MWWALLLFGLSEIALRLETQQFSGGSSPALAPDFVLEAVPTLRETSLEGSKDKPNN